MSGQLVMLYVFLWATLMRALLVKARVLPRRGARRCGLAYERRMLGESVCHCHRRKGTPNRSTRARAASVTTAPAPAASRCAGFFA